MSNLSTHSGTQTQVQFVWHRGPIQYLVRTALQFHAIHHDSAVSVWIGKARKGAGEGEELWSLKPLTFDWDIEETSLKTDRTRNYGGRVLISVRGGLEGICRCLAG
eukprot:49827-Rhodomonas_salina.2